MNPIVEFVTKYNNKTLTEVSLPTLAYPKVYSVFSGMSQLSYVSLPRLKSMAFAMFMNCKSLVSVYMQEVMSIDANAFAGCASLTELAFPQASGIGYYAFSGCTQLSSISLPYVSTALSNVFYSCGLLRLDLPKLRGCSTQGALVHYCPSISEISLPAMSFVGSYSSAAYLASNCSALTHIYLPACTEINGGVNKCVNLDFSGLDAPNAQKISQCFYGASDSQITYSALTEIVHSTVQYLNISVIGNVPNFSRIYLPEVSYLSLSYVGYGSSASPNLTEIYLPKLRYIDGSMFPYAPVTSLTIPWSQIETIRTAIVTSSAPCVSTITELSLPMCSYLLRAPLGSVNDYLISLYCAASYVSALSEYHALKTVTLPTASGMQTLMFCNCPELETAVLPVASYMNGNAFAMTKPSYYSISTPELRLNFPMCSVVGDNAFLSNNKLRELHLSICSQINGNSTFYHCSNFMSLYLYSTAVVTLQYNASNVFAGTPMRQSVNGVYGSIFVPASLITNYQTNGSWSWVKDRFAALPE